VSARGPAPTPDALGGLETSQAPTERAAWEAALDRYEAYRRYLLGRTSAPTDSEAALLARYQAAEQAAWEAYKAALRQVQGVAA
jgi:hypothetical protein